MRRHEELEAQRESLLSQMRLIRSMRRGTLSVRPEKVRRKGQKEPVLLGPYPLFVRNEGKRTVGCRLRTPEEVAQAREDIAAYHRFMGLCKEYVQATEELGQLERTETVADALKKGLKSRSNRARKSHE
jgi:hypothetical protein